MKRVLAFAAFLFTICGHVSAQVNPVPNGLENAERLTEVVAVETEAYTFDRGDYVPLDYRFEQLETPTSEEDLIEQLYWVEGLHFKLKTTARVYVISRLLDEDGEVLYESQNSFRPEKVKDGRKSAYQVPWYASNFYFDPMWGNNSLYHEVEKSKRIKPIYVDIYFNSVDIGGIEQAEPDLHGYVNLLNVGAEWGFVPAFETMVGKDEVIKLFARSQSGFKPSWVKVTTYDEIGDGVSAVYLDYLDRMSIEVDPGTLYLIEPIFDQDPVGFMPPTGGKG
jgi:hypothetical protein